MERGKLDSGPHKPVRKLFIILQLNIMSSVLIFIISSKMKVIARGTACVPLRGDRGTSAADGYSIECPGGALLISKVSVVDQQPRGSSRHCVSVRRAAGLLREAGQYERAWPAAPSSQVTRPSGSQGCLEGDVCRTWGRRASDVLQRPLLVMSTLMCDLRPPREAAPQVNERKI